MTAINCFWVGDRLGEIHAACVRSFLRHGYRVVLHCYEEPKDLPAGIETFDASKLLPFEDVLRYRRTKSYALGANIYRLKILEQGMGIYVDCDVFCLKPLPERDYLFGWEQSHQINNAVLNLPKDSELLQAMIAFTAQKYPIPPWLKPEKRIVLQVRRAIGLPVHVARQSWGTYGPVALTYFIKKLGLAHHALPIDYFYAFYGNFWPLLAEEGLSLSDLITPRSYAIHLSASGLGDTKIKPRTPLAELVEA